MTPVTEAVWCWCHTCGAWIGSQPCVLPTFWSNRKAKGLHRTGSPTHRTELVGLADALAIAAGTRHAGEDRAEEVADAA